MGNLVEISGPETARLPGHFGLAFAVGIVLFGAAPWTGAVAGGPCNVDEDCEDGNLCTDDVCDTGFCEHSFNHAVCDDGCACTKGDVCDGGECSGVWDPGCDKCIDDSECEDGDPCTDNTCWFGTCPLGGVCVITPACDDGNPCTDDTCGPQGQCFNVTNYDSASMCCNPSDGSVSVIECDQTNCYDPICIPMGCTCCDRSGGDPCAVSIVPTVSDWALAVMALLVVTMGSLAIRRAKEDRELF